MVDWTQMLRNLSSSLVEVEKMVFYVFALVGISLIISGVLGLLHFGTMMQPDSGERKEAILKILAGALLFGLAKFTIPVLLTTFFGRVDLSDFSNVSMSPDLLLAIKRVTQLAGVIWIGLGIQKLIQEDKSEQSKSFKGVTYLVAGVMALNFEYAARVLDYLFHLLTLVFK